MFYTFTGVHPGFLSSLLSRTPTWKPDCFFSWKPGEKHTSLEKLPNSHPQNLWWKSYCGSWLLKVVHLLADQGVWRLGICCHHECQASRLHFGFLCHLASQFGGGDTWGQQDPCGKWGKSYWKVGEGWVKSGGDESDESDGKVNRCLPVVPCYSAPLEMKQPWDSTRSNRCKGHCHFQLLVVSKCKHLFIRFNTTQYLYSSHVTSLRSSAESRCEWGCLRWSITIP